MQTSSPLATCPACHESRAEDIAVQQMALDGKFGPDYECTFVCHCGKSWDWSSKEPGKVATPAGKCRSCGAEYCGDEVHPSICPLCVERLRPKTMAEEMRKAQMAQAERMHVMAKRPPEWLCPPKPAEIRPARVTVRRPNGDTVMQMECVLGVLSAFQLEGTPLVGCAWRTAPGEEIRDVGDIEIILHRASEPQLGLRLPAGPPPGCEYVPAYDLPIPGVLLERPPVAHQAGTPDRYPHTCPRCGGPAYVGLGTVDCAQGCQEAIA